MREFTLNLFSIEYVFDWIVSIVVLVGVVIYLIKK